MVDAEAEPTLPRTRSFTTCSLCFLWAFCLLSSFSDFELGAISHWTAALGTLAIGPRGGASRQRALAPPGCDFSRTKTKQQKKGGLAAANREPGGSKRGWRPPAAPVSRRKPVTLPVLVMIWQTIRSYHLWVLRHCTSKKYSIKHKKQTTSEVWVFSRLFFSILKTSCKKTKTKTKSPNSKLNYWKKNISNNEEIKNGGQPSIPNSFRRTKKNQPTCFHTVWALLQPHFTYTLQPLAFAADAQPPLGKQIILINKIKN